MKQYIIRLLFKVDASGLKKQLQSISKEAARVGAAMAKSMNRAFKTVAKEGGNASKQVVKSLDTVEKKTVKVGKEARSLGKDLGDVFGAVAVGSAIRTSIQNFAKLESGLVKLQSAAQLFGKDFEVIKKGLLDIRKEGVLSFETLNYTARQLVTPAFGIAADQVDDFIKGLRNIAAVEGIYEDLDFAITSFVRGLQTGTAELLENLSPRIRAFIQTEAGGFAKVQKDQAARQKVFNEIFRASTELQGEYERQLATTTIRTNVLNQRLLESSEIVGDLFNPTYENAVVVLSNILKAINSLISPLGTFGKSIVATSIAVGALAVSLKGLSAALALIGITLNPLAAGITLVSGALFVFLNSLSRGSDEVRAAREEFKKYKEQLEKIEKIDPTKSTLAYADAQEKLRNAAIRVNKALGEQIGATAELINLQVDQRNKRISDLKADLKIIESEIRTQVNIAESEKATPFGGVNLEAVPRKARFSSESSLENILKFLDNAIGDGGSSPIEGVILNELRSALNIRRQLDLLEALTAEKIDPGSLRFDGAGGSGEEGATGRRLPALSGQLELTRLGRFLELDIAASKFISSIEEFAKFEENLEELERQLKAVNSEYSAKAYLEALREEALQKAEIAKKQEIVNEENEKLIKSLDKALKSYESNVKQISIVSDSINSLDESLRKLDGSIVSLLDAFTETSSTIADFFSDKLGEVVDQIDSLKGEGKPVPSSLTSQAQELGLFSSIFQGLGFAGAFLGGAASIFSLFDSGDDAFLRELELQRAIQQAQADYLKTLVDLDIQRQQAERSALDRQIETERLTAERQKELLQATLTGDDLQEERLKIDERTNQSIISLLQQRLAKIEGGQAFADLLGGAGVKVSEDFPRLQKMTPPGQAPVDFPQKRIIPREDVITDTLKEVSQRIFEREQVGFAIEKFQSQVASLDLLLQSGGATRREIGRLGTEFIEKIRQTAALSPEVIKALEQAERNVISRAPIGSLSPRLDEMFNRRVFDEFIGLFDLTKGKDSVLTEQYDILKQIYDLETSQIGIQNNLLSDIADNTSNLKQIEPRGFGAVDVSRGGLAFGRDFIPTAASLISNVGVPAQIGSLSVAAEANKTMDQKMLDSLQNQLIELKAQTNLLAQLTNTDARIVIANAQQAVKATGF